MSLFQSAEKRARRRVWPIHAYVGANGGGKSASMVWDTLPSIYAGRRILSTVRILDFANPRECSGCDSLGHEQPVYRELPPPEGTSWDQWRQYTLPEERLELVGSQVHQAAHPLWVPFTDWEQLLEARKCDVLMDEVTGVGSSRESQSMPAPVANKLVQLRRADVVVRWSSPAWARADKIIRETSQAVTFCQGYFPKKSRDSEADRVWSQRRLFRWKTYDAADFEDFTVGKREQLRPLVVDHHWGPGSPSFAAYDTYDAVLSIGTVTDSGRCYRCGGRRRVPECRCASHSAEAAAPEGGSPAGGPAGVGAGGRRALRVLDT